jgi:hypothetical protein
VSVEKLLAARDILSATQRTLQLLDENIKNLQQGRRAVTLSASVSSEQRCAFFGAVDDLDKQNGILVAQRTLQGFGKTYTGTISVQEDAAFVCTNVLVAGTSRLQLDAEEIVLYPFSEDVFTIVSGGVLIALKDGNTGRNLTPGLTTRPLDKDRGAVPLSALTSVRAGLGSNNKNSFFSEFTIPRSGTIKVFLWNMSNDITPEEELDGPRIFITLLGYKVFGA